MQVQTQGLGVRLGELFQFGAQVAVAVLRVPVSQFDSGTMPVFQGVAGYCLEW